jgi:gluconate 2-dehydrogenase gamma chain
VPDDSLSRRLFLQGTGSLAGWSAVRLSVPGVLALAEAATAARDEGAAFEILSASEAMEFDAIAARILPTTETPGAREAGVIYFMDKALASFMADELDSIRQGLADFQSGLPTSFSELSEADQDAYLGVRDHTHFFNRLRFITIAGFFGMSSYGGNRDGVGWKLIGFDGDQDGWASPFGYYDAEYMYGKQSGE